jgi:hypothetical protein
MKLNSIHWRQVAGRLLLALLMALPAIGMTADRDDDDHDNDDATARRQAMYEWYTDDYSHHGETGLANHKPMYFAPEYARFLNGVARQERQRYAALMPGSKTTVRLPNGTLASSWTNIGPDRANFEQNGGTLFVSDSGRANVILTDPNNANVIYIAFSGGGVWKSTDGGTTWAPKTETLGSLSVGTLEMDPSDSNTLYLGLGDPFDGTGIGLVKSTDGGDTWSDVVYLGDSSIITDIEVARSNTQIVLASTDSGLYRSTDGGATFNLVTIATGQSANPYVWTLAWGGGDVFVVGLEAAYVNFGTGTSTLGEIWRSTDNGVTWTQSTGVTNLNGATDNGVGRLYIAAAPSNRSVMYAEAANKNEGLNGTDFADVFKSTDNGVTWTGMGKTAVNGATYKSYTTTNTESKNLSTLLNGQGWYNDLVVVDPSNENVAYFGGALLLVRTNDGGATFTQVSNWLAQFSLPYVHADFHGGTVSSSGALYVGTDGGIFRSTDASSAAAGNTIPTFTDTLNKGIFSHLVYQVGSTTNASSEVIIGLQDDGTRVRVGATTTFNQIIGGDGFGCDISQGDATKMLGSLYYDRIQRSTNSGTSFTNACTGIAECNNSSSAPFVTVLSRWDGDATGNTLFTFSNAKVYKTTNYATSWTALGTTGLPTAASGLIIRGVGSAKSSATTVGVVANSGRVFLTTNGTSWTQIGSSTSLPGNGLSLSSIKFDPTNANIIYVASVAPSLTANHLWRSPDAGTTWAAIDSGAAGFPHGVPVNAVFVDPVTPTTIYAATHLGVYTSSDSGATWTRYGSGMPLVNVTDLYLASDASLIRAGTYGRSVWELTGPAPTTFTVGGTISSLTGSVSLELDGTTPTSTQTQAFSANGSFTFNTALAAGSDWTVSVATQPTGQTCSVTNGSGSNISANVTNVQVNCVTQQFTLTYSAGANGTISGTTPQTVNFGADGTAVTAVPNTGYHFVQWSDSSTANPRTDTDVTADITVTASFAANPATQLAFTTQPSTIIQGGTTNATVSVEDALGNVVTTDNTTQIALSVNACGSTSLGTVTVTNGVAQFTNLQFLKVNTGLKLHATSNPVLTPADSNAFDVQSDGDKIFADGFDGCVP